MIAINKNYKSPHFINEAIPVEFVIIHYTAQGLQASLDIFTKQKSPKVSAHLLIDERGEVYELVSCWDGSCAQAFHAGLSRYKDSSGQDWNQFNQFSIGIELINKNGNIFPYTQIQYNSLFKTLTHLQNFYPALKNPERILGHEHIAGFRGKRDPGYLFDWPLLFHSVYQSSKDLKALTSKKQYQKLVKLLPTSLEDLQAKKISLILEKPWPFWIKKIMIKQVMV